MSDLIIFGDSITYGASDAVAGGWANQLARLVDKKRIESGSLRPYVYNLGVPSEDIRDTRKRFEHEIVAREDPGDPYALIFAVGINDSRVLLVDGSHRVPLEEFKTVYEEVVRAARANAAHIVLLGLTAVDELRVNPVPWRSDAAYRNDYIRTYDVAIATIATANDLLYIPMFDLFDNRPDLLTDGLHPNAEGHRMMFERVRKCLEDAKII